MTAGHLIDEFCYRKGQVMGTAWACSHQVGDVCILLSKPCNPGDKGCTLYGKALFADIQTASNAAVERRENKRIAQAREEERRGR